MSGLLFDIGKYKIN